MLKNVFKSFIIKITAVIFIAVLIQPVLRAESGSPDDMELKIEPKYKFSYKAAKDPFIPKYKSLKTLNLAETVDISALILIGITESGGDMAALFRSRLGDTFGFILMGSKLFGSNDNEIQGIVGEIKNSTEVILRQGDNEILFTLDEENIKSSIRPTATDPEK